MRRLHRTPPNKGDRMRSIGSLAVLFALAGCASTPQGQGGIEEWSEHHPAASQELGVWVQQHTEAPSLFFQWDSQHPDRAHELVTWTLYHPAHPIDGFIVTSPACPY